MTRTRTSSAAINDSEMHILRDIQRALCDIKGLRLWRMNVTGNAWVGDIDRRTDTSVILDNPRPWRTYLPNGFPDLFGVLETPAGPMPVFIEVKSATGRPTQPQRMFLAAMKAIGCRAGIARSVTDAVRIINGEMQ